MSRTALVSALRWQDASGRRGLFDVAPNALSVKGWRPLFDQAADRANDVHHGLRALLGAELDHLEKHWPGDLPKGVIHADLFPDNVFFLGEKLSGLIDFYFACNDMLAYDVAICLNAWCFEIDHSFNVTKARLSQCLYARAQADRSRAGCIAAAGAALRCGFC
jgi:homoserine kinase type II